MSNSRALLIVSIVIFLFAGLVAKLVDIQIVKSDDYKYLAQKHHTKLENVKAERGFIYDRNNVLLVYNRNDFTFYLDLNVIKENEKQNIVQRFSSVFGKSASNYSKMMNQTGRTIKLEKKVPVYKANLLKNIKSQALFSIKEPTRIYQYGSLASHVLGYVNSEFVGMNGIENYFRDILNGEEGNRLVERDALGGIVTISDAETKPAVPGDNLVLTIDKNYQSILEEELRLGLNTYKGQSATGIIMDPNTGEILALANIDDFDPNNYGKYPDFQRKDRAITDTYEPGSTFKTFSLAALIDAGKCNEGEVVYVENGKYKFENIYIRDTHKNTYLTVSGILEESSNIGISKLIQRLDNDTYYKYLRGFGFGNYTSIALPGEVTGKLKKPNQWSKFTKTFMSFGYEVSVTPIQLITAYAAILNGGILYEPHILKYITDNNGNIKNTIYSNPVRRVISEETSKRITKILVGAVEKGTGTLARLENISAGGKTGTSQQYLDGNYSKQNYNTSFVGFFPADHPQLVCLVLVDAPQVEKYGGKVAAPIFNKIAERILEIDLKKYQQPEHYDGNEDLEQQVITTELKKIENENVVYNTNSVRFVDNKVTGTKNNLMPDLRGLSVKDAMLRMNILGLKYNIAGSGTVTSQSIKPGEKIYKNQICKLNCSEISIKGANIY
jgi:cell division protein FtsI (penicillin-binding protein 3)